MGRRRGLGTGAAKAESKALNDRLARWVYAIPAARAKMLRTRLDDLTEPAESRICECPILPCPARRPRSPGLALPRDLPDGPENADLPRLPAHDRGDRGLVHGKQPEKRAILERLDERRAAARENGDDAAGTRIASGALAVAALLGGCGSGAAGGQSPAPTKRRRRKPIGPAVQLAEERVGPEIGINQDILATRGTDWQRSQVGNLQTRTMTEMTRDRAAAIVASCMAAYGFQPAP